VALGHIRSHGVRHLRRATRLDKAAADLVPTTTIGRMLSLDEAARLIRRIERQIPKRPASASVRRAVKRKRA
jgi:hypothetical protein